MFGVGLAAGSKPTFQTEFNTDGDGGNTGGFETAVLRGEALLAFHGAGLREGRADSNLPGIRTTAFLSPDGNRLVVVALNVADVEKTVKLATGSFTAITGSAVSSVFSGTQAYWTASALGAENSLSMPPDSVVIAVFEK